MSAAFILGFFAAIATSVQATDGNARLPNILIIGDSISIDYTKPLSASLKGKATVVHSPGNAQDSGVGLKNIDNWLGDTKWDVIHFNHGLHDLACVERDGKDTESGDCGLRQIPLDAYERNMEAIVVRLRKTHAKLIFATTTPFPAGVNNPIRVPEDVVKYNAAALKIMKKYGIAIGDLYTFVLPQREKLQKPKNVHFTDNGSEMLATEVANHILKALGQPTDAREPR